MLLLHPLTETVANKQKTKVLRHIELTAVTLKSVTIIKESKRIVRFENH